LFFTLTQRLRAGLHNFAPAALERLSLDLSRSANASEFPTHYFDPDDPITRNHVAPTALKLFFTLTQHLRAGLTS
jgi:hypothetical protein